MSHPSGVDRKHPDWVNRMKRAEGGATPSTGDTRKQTMEATFGSMLPPSTKSDQKSKGE